MCAHNFLFCSFSLVRDVRFRLAQFLVLHLSYGKKYESYYICLFSLSCTPAPSLSLARSFIPFFSHFLVCFYGLRSFYYVINFEFVISVSVVVMSQHYFPWNSDFNVAALLLPGDFHFLCNHFFSVSLSLLILHLFLFIYTTSHTHTHIHGRCYMT